MSKTTLSGMLEGLMRCTRALLPHNGSHLAEARGNHPKDRVPVFCMTTNCKVSPFPKGHVCPQMPLCCPCLSARWFTSTEWHAGEVCVHCNLHPLEIISVDFIKLEELHFSFAPFFQKIIALLTNVYSTINWLGVGAMGAKD